MLRESVVKYCEKLRAASNRSNTRGEATATLTAERARLASQQADVMALRAARERGEMVPAKEVTARWRGLLTAVRSRFLAIPSRIRAQIPHLTRPEVDIIGDEIRDALEGLADGDA